MRICAIFLLLQLFAAFVMAQGVAPTLLVAEQPPIKQTVVSGSAVTFVATHLRPGIEYEVLISWPASQPCWFDISLENERTTSRSLFNTEKLVFVCRSDSEKVSYFVWGSRFVLMVKSYRFVFVLSMTVILLLAS
jgi:hypothetical protein